jgi:DNA polymerase-3 subunit delta
MILNLNKEANIFVIIGDNNYINNKIKDICDNKNLEIETFYGDEFNRSEYFNFIFTPSLFHEYKLAVIKNAEKISNVDELIKESRKENINKKILCLSPQYEKIIEKLKNDENILIIKEEKKSYKDTINEIIDLFNRAKIKINYNDAREVYEMLGRDINLIKNEIEKIELYFYDKNMPSIDEIFEFISISQYNVTFKFADALCFKNKKDALIFYNQLMMSHVNLNMLFYFLVRQFRDILQYKISPDLVTGHSFMVSKISKAAKYWSIPDLKKVFEEFLSSDYLLKRSSVKIEHIILNLINTI